MAANVTCVSTGHMEEKVGGAKDKGTPLDPAARLEDLARSSSVGYKSSSQLWNVGGLCF